MIELKCPNCKADIELDETRDFGFCRYCGTKVLIEPNKSKVDGIAGIDNLLLRAEQFYKENNFTKALEYYNRVLDVDINNLHAKQGILEIQKKRDIKVGDIVNSTVIDITGRSYVGCIIVQLENGQEYPLPLSDISPNISRANISIGDKFTLVCESMANNRPILVSQEVKAIHNKEKNTPFAEQLINMQQETEKNINNQIQTSFVYDEVKEIVHAIKNSCAKHISDHKIEGIYRPNDGWDLGPSIWEVSEQEADKSAVPRLRIYESGLGGGNARHGTFSRNDIDLLNKLLRNELSALGFTKFYYKFIPIKHTKAKQGKLNSVKKTFFGDTIYELTGVISYDLFIRIEW